MKKHAKPARVCAELQQHAMEIYKQLHVIPPTIYVYAEREGRE